MKPSLRLNMISSTTLYCVNILAAFFVSPVMIRVLGNFNYGVWDVILSMIGYMGLLDLGMGPALMRYVALANSRSDLEKLRRVVSSAAVFFCGIGVMGFLLTLCAGFFSHNIFSHNLAAAGNLKLVLLIISVNLLLQFPGAVLAATLMGLQCHFVVNSTRIIICIVQSVVIIRSLPLFAEDALVTVATIETAGIALQYTFFLILFLMSDTLPKPRFKDCSWAVLKEMLSYGFNNSVLMLSSRLQKQSVPLILGRFVGIDRVVFFSVPNRLVEYARGFAIALGMPLMPHFVGVMATSSTSEVRANWKKTSLLLQAVTLMIACSLLFLGYPFLKIWLGPDLADKSRVVLQLLMVGLVAEAVSPNAGRLLLSVAKHGRAAKAWLIISVLFVPAAVFCAKWWGLPGVAGMSAVATTVGSLLTLRYACDEVGITLREHVASTVLPIVPALFVMCLVYLSREYLFVIDSYFKLICTAILGVVFYCATFWLVVGRKHLPALDCSLGRASR